MSTYDIPAENSSGVRPRYIHLGIDAEGCSHCYRTTDETVHVVRETRREHVEPVRDRPVEEWMAFVADRRGAWLRRDYAAGMVAMVSRAVDT